MNLTIAGLTWWVIDRFAGGMLVPLTGDMIGSGVGMLNAVCAIVVFIVIITCEDVARVLFDVRAGGMIDMLAGTVVNLVPGISFDVVTGVDAGATITTLEIMSMLAIANESLLFDWAA